jgi:S-adenosylmethionine decarboxylase
MNNINTILNTPLAPGIHLLIDYWGAQFLQDAIAIEAAFKRAIKACGATLVNIQLHSFGEGSGITGVAILAESHMSIHTWPEIDYLAMDIFVCGNCDPYLALAVLNDFFKPQHIKVTEHKRGTPCDHINNRY